MKFNFTDKELKILTNFSKIHHNILFKKNNDCFETMSTMKQVFARFKTGRKFNEEFGIYDLPEFLNYIDLFDEAQFEYKQTKGNFGAIEIKDKNRNLFYPCAEKSTLVFPPTNVLQLINPDKLDSFIEFDFKSENFEMTKFIKVNKYPDLLIFNENGEIKFQSLDKKNNYGNKFTLNLKQKTNRNFKVLFKEEIFSQMLESDYKVKIFKERISVWENKYIPLKYYISLEPDCEFA